MKLKGFLIACVALLLCECDTSFLPAPFHLRGSPFQHIYSDDTYQRLLLHQRFDPTVSEPSSEVLEKEYRPETNTKYSVFTEKLSWYEARDNCKSKGMVLASPDSSTKENDLIQYIHEHDLEPIDAYSGYWLGSRRSTDDDPWIWESNGQEVGLFGWLPGEPNGYKGENCMELKVSYTGLGWNNYYCDGMKRFICEKLPHMKESDKNTMTDTKQALHEEVLKESWDDKEDSNESLDALIDTYLMRQSAGNEATPSSTDILHSSTTATERESLSDLPGFNPDAIIFRDSGDDYYSYYDSDSIESMD